MNPTIHFKIRIERPSPDGSTAVFMRVTFNRKQILSFSIGQTIPLKKEYQKLRVEEIKQIPTNKRYDLYCWDNEKERATKGFGNTETLNLFLDDEKKRANDIVYDLNKKERLTPDNFKKEFLKADNANNITLLEYCLNEINKNRSEQFASETKRSYKSVITKLNNYKPNIRLSDITYKFLTEYENFMLTTKEEKGAGNNKRTVENNMKIIRTFISMACKNGDLSEKNYPFRDFKIKETPKFFSTRDFLEPDEILSLEGLMDKYVAPSKPMKMLSNEDWETREKAGIITPGEYKTLRSFLIGIYTGLRFRDVLALDKDEHIRSRYISNPKSGERNLKYYLEIDLHKTGVNVIIPLIDKALKLIDVNEKGKVCKNISNTKANKHLKSVQGKSKIEKTLTFHVSRHSFASTAFEYGIPEKVVQSILGHRNKKFTEIYTHLSNKRLFFEMEKMDKGYNETALLLNEVVKEQSKAMQLALRLQNLDENKLKKLTEFLEVMAA